MEQIKRYKWKERWRGVNTFTITCFTPDLKVDYDAERKYYRHLLNFDICGLGINGHTGEGEALSREEKKKLIRIAQEEVQGRIPICTGIHARSIDEGIEEAKEMEKTGVDVLHILSPSFYLFDAREDPRYGIEYHKAVAKAVNIPVAMHQVYGTVDEYPTWAFAKLFKEIDNLVAVKLANGYHTLWHKYEADLEAARAIGRDNISLFAGSMKFVSLLWGCDGTWGGYNAIDPSGVIDLWNAVKRCDLEEARRIHKERLRPAEMVYIFVPMVDLMSKYKQLAYWLGLIPSPAVRHRWPLTEEVKKILLERAKKVGLDLVRED